jgi:hypothetical protein
VPKQLLGGEINRCGTLALRSIKMSAGIAGKDVRVVRECLARDCDSPLPPQPGFDSHKKLRWLLWLEDTSMDESRRAAAALRNQTAMLTNRFQGAEAPLHTFAVPSTPIEKEHP